MRAQVEPRYETLVSLIAECEAAASRKATAAREVKAAEAAMHSKLAAEAEASAELAALEEEKGFAKRPTCARSRLCRLAAHHVVRAFPLQVRRL